ncbi:hypothetical protein K9B35_08280 [Sphingomonas sp. R647]|uniref:hypothetical protein n=1 Tax=Sphingomonas sp. R647 TaxID=2875233 RepID=UPI001CD61CCD|nr:hypothetical protein [Sphingomonas sp. R647]MCA1197960.1 hypothetical protein [Sphingomonas sp. R647]
MRLFQILLIALWLVLVAYTGVVIARHGIDLLPVFFGDMAKVAWPGQFNLDFMCFLVLSALWTAWRSGFSAGGLTLALVAFFAGAGFLLPYLLWLTISAQGDMRRVLLGTRA